jgi:hypothetical protein
MSQPTIRSYPELLALSSFEERYDYLQLSGSVGATTFGFDRYLNQMLYTSRRWLRLRDEIILRDQGCDLAIPGREIFSRILVHHMNPITVADMTSDKVFNPEYLICTTHKTHQAIHYGSKALLSTVPKDRLPGDTKLW